MYCLTLTKDERKAFTLVGDRYASFEVYRILLDCLPEEMEWNDEGDISFIVPEYTAWMIRDLAEQDETCWTLFAPELVQKLTLWIERIV